MSFDIICVFFLLYDDDDDDDFVMMNVWDNKIISNILTPQSVSDRQQINLLCSDKIYMYIYTYKHFEGLFDV